MAKKKPRLRDWLNERDEVPPRFARENFGNTYTFKYLLDALRSRAPGQWSQNLLELSRHFTSAIFLAVNTLANQVAAAEWKAYERDPDIPDGKSQLHHTDPLCRLIEDPNGDDSTADLGYQLTQQLDITGMALIWVPRDNALDLPSEMYVIPTATAFPLPQSDGYPQGAYRILPLYPYGPFTTLPSYQSAAGAIVPADQVIRIKNHHPLLRYDGYAVLTALQLQIDTVEAIDRSRWNTQQKGVDPSVAMTFDPEVFNPDETDLHRLREQLEALYTGPLNAGKILFNPYGTNITRLSSTPAEMAWQEGWSQLVDFILAAYGVPKSVAGLQDDVSYATLHSSLKQFYLFSLNPRLQKIGNKFNKHLVRPFFGSDLCLEITAQKITDEDLLERQLGTDAQVGARTLNEWRKVRGLPPWPGPEGNQRLLASRGKPGESDLAATIAVEGAGRDGEPMRDPDQLAVARTRPTNPDNRGALGPRPKKALVAALARHGHFPTRECRDLWESSLNGKP
jgi:phage portal protein BeeE